MASFELRVETEKLHRRASAPISMVATASLPRSSFLVMKFVPAQPKEKASSASARTTTRSSGYGKPSDPPRKMFQPVLNRRRAKSGDIIIRRPGVEVSDMSNSIEKEASRSRWKKMLVTKPDLQSASPPPSFGYPTRLVWSSSLWTTPGARLHVAASTATATGSNVVAAAGPDNVVSLFKCRNDGQSKDGFSMEDYVSLSAGHGRRVLALDVSHSGAMALAATDDHSVAVFECKAGREPRVRIGDENHISSASRNMVRSAVYGYSSSKSAASASAKSFSFGAVITRAQFFFLDQFVLSASANRVVAHSIDTEEWTCKLKKVFTFSDCHSVTAMSAANAFPSYYALCACSDRRLRVLDLGRESVASVISSAGNVSAIAQPIDGNHHVFATVAAIDGAKIWDLRLCDPVQQLDWPGSSSASRLPPGLAMSPCGGFVAAGAASAAYVFDLRSAGAFVNAFESRSAVTDVCFVRDASCLAAVTHDGRLNVYSV